MYTFCTYECIWNHIFDTQLNFNIEKISISSQIHFLKKIKASVSVLYEVRAKGVGIRSIFMKISAI